MCILNTIVAMAGECTIRNDGLDVPRRIDGIWSIMDDEYGEIASGIVQFISRGMYTLTMFIA